MRIRIVTVPYVGNSWTEEAEKQRNGKVTYRTNSVAVAVAHVHIRVDHIAIRVNTTDVCGITEAN